MRPSRRPGVSGYLEVFLLIGVAVGGSALVFGSEARNLGAAAGPSVSIVSAAISQGRSSAVESVTVADVGTVPLGSILLTTSQPPPSAPYCYSVEDTENATVLLAACPAPGNDPGSVGVSVVVSPGGTVVLELVVEGAAYAVGSSHQVSVITSSGAEASAYVQVVPA